MPTTLNVNSRKSYQFWGKLAQKQKSYRQENKLGACRVKGSYSIDKTKLFPPQKLDG